MLWNFVWCLDGESRKALVDHQRRYYDRDYKLPVPDFGGRKVPFVPDEVNTEVKKVMEATPGDVKHWREDGRG